MTPPLPTAQPAGLLLPGLFMKTEFRVALKPEGRPVAANAHPGLDLLYVHIPPFDPTAHPSTGPIVAKYTDVMLHPATFAHCATVTPCHQFDVIVFQVYAAGQKVSPQVAPVALPCAPTA